MDEFEKLKDMALNFTKERNWMGYHTPKNLSMAISIESAELMEHFQWLTSEESLEKCKGESFLDLIKGEIADISIYILHLSNLLDLNLSKIIQEKIEINKTRSWNINPID